MPRLYLRLFTHPKSSLDQHSFMINSLQGGCTERLDGFIIEDGTTLTKLRQILEFKIDRGMLRRTPFYQELLFLMQHAPNPHGYGKDRRYQYRFGVYNENGGGDLNLISKESEQQGMRVVDFCENLARQDMVIIPATQISPSGELTPVVEEMATEVSSSTSTLAEPSGAANERPEADD
ncbi:unnamed protein product [Chrysoparadoxa australica]